MSNKNMLIVVEGGKTEKRFFTRLSEAFHLPLDIFAFEKNIYMLYAKMKQYHFQADLRDVLLEDCHDQSLIEQLNKTFAYTYLIFDFDAHHHWKEEEDTPLEQLISRNIAQLSEMLCYFDNETDPSKGKLYVNYPMMESYRDCAAFFDDDYQYRFVKSQEISEYKSIVDARGLLKQSVQSYRANDFMQLARMNVFKLHMLSGGSWAPLAYRDYLALSAGDQILKKEEELISSERLISVLNTASFFPLDYYGNKDGFYDFVVQNNR